MIDYKTGLTSKQVEESKEKYGTNALSKKDRESFWKMFLEAFDDIWIKFLLLALGLKAALIIAGMFIPALANGASDVVDLLFVLISILLATGLSSSTEYKTKTRGATLQEEYSKTYTKVVRDGKLHDKILTSDLVVGDIVLVQSGNKVPVDGLIRHGKIKVSQAALNGESVDETKLATDSDLDAKTTDYHNDNKVFMGSTVSSGEAYIEVTVVGDETELGKMNLSLVDKEADESEYKDPTALKLEKIANMIGDFGKYAAFAAAALNIIFGIINHDGTLMNFTFWGLLIADTVMLMAAIFIAVIPEGLPLVMALLQSMNAESMHKKNVLVQDKDKFQNCAYSDTVCFDKTGTVTYGNLVVSEFILGDGSIVKDYKNEDFISNITVNNMSKVADGKAIGSNNMDCALLNYAISQGYEEDNELKDSLIKEMNGFNSEQKCATVVLNDGSLYWKGATEVIIDKITHYVDIDNEVKEFSGKQVILDKIEEQAKRSMKMLSIVKIVGEKYILQAVICLRDELRPTTKGTIQTLHDAGIQTVMITGDAKTTAEVIAEEAGIYNKEEKNITLTHDELEGMTDEEVKAILPKLSVVSRAKPLDKKRLVKLFQEENHVVMMGGDGLNDSPAIKNADCGVAMHDGSEVAQSVASVILLDNSLDSISNAILAARTMAHSVSKFLIFQISGNVVLVIMSLLAGILSLLPCVGGDLGEIMSIPAILFLNLVVDCFCALLFGGEPMLSRYMKEKPAKKTDPIMTKYVWSAIIGSTIFMVVGSILLLTNAFGIIDKIAPAGYGASIDIIEYKKSVFFAFFMYSMLFNSLNTRSEGFNIFEHIGENKRFIWLLALIFAVLTLIMVFFGGVFSIVSLGSWKTYLIVIGLASLIIPFDMIRKFLFKKN